MDLPNIVLCPASSFEAEWNFKASVAKTVKLSREALLSGGLEDSMPVRVWATSPKLRAQWNKVRSGDVLVFIKNQEVFSYARCLKTVESEMIAQAVWGSPERALLFVLDEPRAVSIPAARLNSVLGYSPKYHFRPLRALGSADSRAVLGLLGIEE
jgi:hypothetical protein